MRIIYDNNGVQLVKDGGFQNGRPPLIGYHAADNKMYGNYRLQDLDLGLADQSSSQITLRNVMVTMTPDSTDPKAVADANCIAWAKRDRLLDEVLFDPTIHYCPETDEKAVTDFRYRRLNEPPVSKNWFHTRINYLSFRRFDGRQVRTAITGTVRTVDGRPVVDVVLNRLNSNQVGDTVHFLVVHFKMFHCYAANSNAFP